MNYPTKILLLSLGFLLVIQEVVKASGKQDQNFFRQHAEGWFWYKDEPVTLEEGEETPQHQKDSSQRQVAPRAVTAEDRATQEVENFKKAIEGKRNLALSNPTHENVAEYMRIQQEMANRARHFGQVWQQVVLNEPALNYERVYPTAQYARHIQDEEQQKIKEGKIRDLAREYGLFYFFKSGCRACEGFSPIVKLFSEKYQWDVMAISVDGSPNPYFPNTQTDNGISEELGIKAVPALIAFHSATGNLIPISYAMTSLDRLEDNIMTLTREQGVRQ
jgi:conjugal transfer pilus assembly protein TraF